MVSGAASSMVYWMQMSSFPPVFCGGVPSQITHAVYIIREHNWYCLSVMATDFEIIYIYNNILKSLHTTWITVDLYIVRKR